MSRRMLMLSGGVGIALLILAVLIEKPSSYSEGGILTKVTSIYFLIVIGYTVVLKWILPIIKRLKKKNDKE